MNRFIFIPGKNPHLSLAELVSWYDYQGLYLRITEKGNGFIAAEAEKAPNADSLGGMIKVCTLLESFELKDLQDPMIFRRAPISLSSKIFGLSVYPDSRKNSELAMTLATTLKDSLAEGGMKAKFMQVPKDRSALTHVEIIKKKLQEIVVCIGEEKIRIARTTSVHNPFEFQKRDMKRPQQRPMFSIPPRLAKIMINLSRKAESKTLLDPFCGIGGVLQEAAIMGLDFYGVDIDESCIPKAKENMKWISKEYKMQMRPHDLEEKVRHADATRATRIFQPGTFDLIVTEPNLGPALRMCPDRNKAEGILRGLKSLYEKSLREFSIILRPGGRLCMVFPRFEFGEHYAHAEAKRTAAKYGMQPVNVLGKYGMHGSLPYIDKEERHKTIREIWVFEKIPEPASRPEDLPELRWTKKTVRD